MKYFRQFGIIILFTFLGEVCRYLIPLPVPASIYGLILILAALMTGIIKSEQVKDAAFFLIEIMPMMFIPAAVGILNVAGVLKGIWIPLVIMIVATSVIVMGVTGKVTQAVIRSDQEKRKQIQETDSTCGKGE